tara:strand:- start:624 stop:1457 length:834 start_codon:yes stop_codon:yes gene_type:complete
MNRFSNFDDARIIVRNKRFKNSSEFRQWKRPFNIPSAPNSFYKDKGWISWMDWLGNDDRQKYGRKYEVDHDFFKHWSSDMSYVLGFWFADGCIWKRKNKNTYRFNISQNRKDQRLLEEILIKMGSNYPIYKLYNEDNCQIRIDSQTIAEDIFRLGGCERKSLICDFPIVPEKYVVDFVRGYFDGDGTIYVSKNQLVVAIGCGSHKFSKGLLNAIDKNAELKVYNVKRGGDAFWLTRMNSSNAEKFCKWIYGTSGALKMERKYAIYKNHMERKYGERI